MKDIIKTSDRKWFRKQLYFQIPNCTACLLRKGVSQEPQELDTGVSTANGRSEGVSPKGDVRWVWESCPWQGEGPPAWARVLLWRPPAKETGRLTHTLTSASWTVLFSSGYTDCILPAPELQYQPQLCFLQVLFSLGWQSLVSGSPLSPPSRSCALVLTKLAAW